jgi:hypothetical protein
MAPQVRANIFTQIHEILFHSQGGYDYDTVYNMPIWLRKFTFNKLKEYYTPKDNKNESSWTQGDVKEEASKNKQIKVPTYVTKASKK